MSKRENDGEINEEKSKHQKPNNAGPSEIAAVAVDGISVRNEEKLSPIYKLNAICCDDVFEWLSLTDLYSLGQTCRRMQRLTGSYYRENFLKKVMCEGRNIYHFNTNRMQINGFIKFIQHIKLNNCNSEDDFQYFGANCDSLRAISFHNVELSRAMIDHIKDKLGNIETIQLTELKPMSIRVYDDFLTFCSNLKTLRIEALNMNSLDGNEWMCHHYPKLEHFMTREFHGTNEMRNLDIFLQKNRQLQCIESTHNFLRRNFDTFITSGLKLDTLIIHSTPWLNDGEFDHLSIMLSRLYDQGFYKRLELDLYFISFSTFHMNQITEFPGLEKLSGQFKRNVVFSTIVDLKELIFCDLVFDNNIVEAVTVSFPNLRRIYFCQVLAHHLLLPFVRRLPKLKEIGIENLIRADLLYQTDLSALNTERKQLAGACKLTIYLPEHDYSQVKMTTRNLYANLDLIDIKRMDSSNMQPEF